MINVNRRFKNKDDEVKRIKHFKRYGFNTLVIWDYDLIDIDKLQNKLTKFHENGK